MRHWWQKDGCVDVFHQYCVDWSSPTVFLQRPFSLFTPDWCCFSFPHTLSCTHAWVFMMWLGGKKKICTISNIKPAPFSGLVFLCDCLNLSIRTTLINSSGPSSSKPFPLFFPSVSFSAIRQLELFRATSQQPNITSISSCTGPSKRKTWSVRQLPGRVLSPWFWPFGLMSVLLWHLESAFLWHYLAFEVQAAAPPLWRCCITTHMCSICAALTGCSWFFINQSNSFYHF